ncbi:MAG TPA: SRPBCC family protein [Thermoanaerobaculia bacterium]|nr:SRPBCC family protein [Thermoanaerobaculia bacterium]
MERRQRLALFGVGLGAGLMYLLDPERGRRRRAEARGKAVHTLGAGGAALGRASRDLAHRGQGLAAGVRSRLHRESVEDRVLEDRVRSKMGHFVSHTHGIEVLADDGEVTLAGDILDSEVAALLAAVRSVRGVRKVDDQLRVHESAEHVSSLQGGSTPPAKAARPWPPAKRLLAASIGSALAFSGLRRRDPIGVVLGTMGLGLIARGMAASGPATLDLHKTVHVEAPIEDVFGYWAEFENFPRFMANVLEVERTGSNCWHWMVRGPAGTQLEWDAELTVFEPERVLAWKSLPGAAVGNSGSVHFTPTGQNGTRVDVRVSLHPPAGALGSIGHGIAALLGRDPSTEMDEDLVRFKALMEEGRTTVEGETVMRGDIPAGPVEPVRFTEPFH